MAVNLLGVWVERFTHHQQKSFIAGAAATVGCTKGDIAIIATKPLYKGHEIGMTILFEVLFSKRLCRTQGPRFCSPSKIQEILKESAFRYLLHSQLDIHGLHIPSFHVQIAGFGVVNQTTVSRQHHKERHIAQGWGGGLATQSKPKIRKKKKAQAALPSWSALQNQMPAPKGPKAPVERVQEEKASWTAKQIVITAGLMFPGAIALALFVSFVMKTQSSRG
jgi:hypothetical protein